MNQPTTPKVLKVENIKPYGDGDKAGQVREMFDSIAPAYDFMNHAMTLGIDRWWRRVAVNTLRKTAPADVLDVATGTGDFAVKLCRRLKPRCVLGIDLSEGMLAVAREKVKKLGLEDSISFSQGDCMALPLDDESVDAVTVAFGVRNFEDLARGYREMLRVLRPGGRLVALELSVPRNRVVRWFYNLYAMHVIPFIGGLRSGDRDAYRYLPRSIAAVPQGRDMAAIMEREGFTDCSFRRLTFGTCTLYRATKPQPTPEN